MVCLLFAGGSGSDGTNDTAAAFVLASQMLKSLAVTWPSMSESGCRNLRQGFAAVRLRVFTVIVLAVIAEVFPKL